MPTWKKLLIAAGIIIFVVKAPETTMSIINSIGHAINVMTQGWH